MPQIGLTQVVKRFGEQAAVAGVDLTVEDGEFMVLVGPSGCGKSTLLRLLAGLDQPTDGEIRFDERRVEHLTPRERDVGMVFQSYALFPTMSVADNIGFGLKVRRAKKHERAGRAREAAQLLGIGELLARKPAQLSGGQRQRVAMARAIARSPAVYLFDEPLSNLDAALRGEIRTLLAQLRDRLRTTTVYVTHDQVEAMTLGDRVAVMRDGLVQQCGPPAEVFQRPANRFVAGFLGSPPMNFAELEVRGGAVELLGARLKLPTVGAEREGSRIVIGIRPTDLRGAGTSGDPEALPLSVQPRVVEAMGTATDVAFEAPDATPDSSLALPLWKARVSKDISVARGEPLALELRAGDLHLFDPVSGERLEREATVVARPTVTAGARR